MRVTESKLLYMLVQFYSCKSMCAVGKRKNLISRTVLNFKKSILLSNISRQLLDFVSPDDAPSPPHERDAAVVQVPLVFSGGFAEQHEALRVRHDLGGVQGLSDVLDELLLVAGIP